MKIYFIQKFEFLHIHKKYYKIKTLSVFFEKFLITLKKSSFFNLKRI